MLLPLTGRRTDFLKLLVFHLNNKLKKEFIFQNKKIFPQIFNDNICDFDMLYGCVKPFQVRLRYSDEPGARSS